MKSRFSRNPDSRNYLWIDSDFCTFFIMHGPLGHNAKQFMRFTGEDAWERCEAEFNRLHGQANEVSK